MKHCLVLFSIVLLFSCQSKNDKQPTDFSGNWISKDYLASLESNHSPRKTADNLAFYATELVINPKKGDSVVVYNGQMERAALPFKRVGDGFRFKINKDHATDLLYSAEDQTLYFVDSTLNRVFRFVRADSSDLDKSYEMPIAFPTKVNQATLAGKHQLYEHNGTQRVVEFGKFGTLSGWDKYDNYMVVVNGDLATNDQTDMLVLGKGTATADLRGLRIEGDTTVIYALKPSAVQGKQKNEQPLALLVRIKK